MNGEQPQSYNNEDINSDSIGNLCLISRRNNSSLNDKDAREKANIDWKGLQPKRRIMYKMTKDDDWGKKQIEEHEKDIEQLLSSRHRLLKFETKSPLLVITAKSAKQKKRVWQ